MRPAVLLLLAALLGMTGAQAGLPVPGPGCRNGEFQFSAEFDNRGVDGGPARRFTAYLWIPPSAAKVRGILVTQQNVGEQRFVEHPAIRTACATNGFAILWCLPAIDLRFEHDRAGAVRLLEEVLRELGTVSGYPEIATVPWIPFGHSTTTTFARNLAEARPERTIAIISAKGGIMLPVTGSFPGVYSGGQYPEWRQPTHDWATHGRSLPGLKKIRDELGTRWRPVSYVEEFGGGHFDYTERYLGFLALYIDKVIAHRLNADGALRAIRGHEGWVVDMQPPLPTAPLQITPLAEATGALRAAPWFIDHDLAKAAVALLDDGRWDRRNQIVAFANLDGTPAAFSNSGIVDPVPCEIAEDGVTITRIETTLLDRLPDNFTQAGMELSHATGGVRTIERISGVFMAEDGRYRIELNRGYPHTPNFIAVRHPGDAQHRPSVQPGRFVPPVHAGREQRIRFDPITDHVVGVKSLALRASSNAGLKVRFFVRSGPAKVVGDELVFLPLPPRAKLPVPVSIVAWQIGRGGEDPVAAAPMVEQSFQLRAPSGEGRVRAVPAKAAWDLETESDVEQAVVRTFGPRQPPVDTAMIATAWKDIVKDVTRPPVKIIFDTDIGTDIDDAIALAFALRRPELEVCAVTTSRGEVVQRAAIVSRLLQVMGRTEVPFAAGSPTMLDGGVAPDRPVNQFPFAGAAGDRPAPAAADAQVLFRRVIEANPGEVWLVVAGPMTNAARLIRDQPEVAAGLKGIVCMGGEPTRPYVETNIRNDPAAAALVCRSGLLKFAGTYDVTVRLLMPKPDLDRLGRSESPLARALCSLSVLWRVDRAMKPGPVVFDIAPLLWLFAPELMTTRAQGLAVDPDGVMTPTAEAPACAVTTEINHVAAHRLLLDTLLQPGVAR